MTHRIEAVTFSTTAQANAAGKFTVPADVCRALGIDRGAYVDIEVQSAAGWHGPVVRQLKSDRQPSPVGEMREWMRAGEGIVVRVRPHRTDDRPRVTDPRLAGPVVADMWRTFAEAGLSLPPVPAALAADLVPMEPWCWSTRPIDPMDMYMFGRYPVEVLTDEAPPYLAISHAGHGVNSYSINYHLVCGALAVFVQVLWGGVYVDAAKAAAEVGDRFEAIANLIDRWLGYRPGEGPDDPMLFVAESAFRDVHVSAPMPDPFTDEHDADRWLRENSRREDALLLALAVRAM